MKRPAPQLPRRGAGLEITREQDTTIPSIMRIPIHRLLRDIGRRATSQSEDSAHDPHPGTLTVPPCLQASLDYCRLGWAAIPLRRRQAAAAQRLAEGQADGAAAARSVGRQPNLNAGVAMGRHSGLLGLDMDTQAGQEPLDQWAGGADRILGP